MTPDLAAALDACANDLILLMTGPERRAIGRRVALAADMQRRNHEPAGCLTSLGKFWYDLTPYTQDDLSNEERAACDQRAAQLIAGEDGCSAGDYAADLSRRWIELSELDRLKAVYAWEIVAHPLTSTYPPLAQAA